MTVPDACTLPTVDQPNRLDEIDEVFHAAVRSVKRVAPQHLSLRLTPDPADAARVASLFVRESACCSFFTFSLIATGGEVTLQVTVPPGYADVLDALAERAAAVRA